MQTDHFIMLMSLVLIPNLYLLYHRAIIIIHLAGSLKETLEHNPENYPEEFRPSTEDHKEHIDQLNQRIVKESIKFSAYAGVVITFTGILIKSYIL